MCMRTEQAQLINNVVQSLQNQMNLYGAIWEFFVILLFFFWLNGILKSLATIYIYTYIAHTQYNIMVVVWFP